MSPTVQFAGEICGAAGRILLDSGAAETYLSSSFAKANNIPIVVTPGYAVATSTNASPFTVHGAAIASLRLQTLCTGSAAALRRPAREISSLTAIAKYPAHFAVLAAAYHAGAVPSVDLLAQIREAYSADSLFTDNKKLEAKYPGAVQDDYLRFNAAGQLIVPAEGRVRHTTVSEAHNPACCGHGGCDTT